jgi:hypothetical protein
LLVFFLPPLELCPVHGTPSLHSRFVTFCSLPLLRGWSFLPLITHVSQGATYAIICLCLWGSVPGSHGSQSLQTLI